MLDDLHRGPDEGPKRTGRSNGERPLADREVPLGPQGGGLSSALHAWLDGELPEAAIRKTESSRDVEFWRRMNGELQQRSHMRTPAYLEAQIMGALPDRAPAQMITPWWRREMVLSPATIFGAAAALVALTALATAVLTQ
jgi:anti-sigma factor RsiW